MHKEKNKIYNNGFSLLELSIVLSIIGLIAGGVTVGANIIHAAQLRAVITDINSYTSAMLAFKDKFDGLPGDLTNATEFWGEADANPATCNVTASIGIETCDGDGDGRLTWNNEGFRAWQHMVNANMLEGEFSGAGTYAKIESNIPGTAVPNGGYSFIYVSVTEYAYAEDHNTIHIGSENQFVASEITKGALFAPNDAWTIDKKIDDGIASSGFIYSFTGINASGSCKIGLYPNINYKLANDEISCTMGVLLDY